MQHLIHPTLFVDRAVCAVRTEISQLCTVFCALFYVFIVLAMPVFSDPNRVSQPTLDDYLWKNRLILVFADSALDPRYTEQIELLNQDMSALKERDVVIIGNAGPENDTPLHRALRPHGFTVVLIGKDGGVKLRKPKPTSARDFIQAIDKMPMRQQEIRQKQREQE